MAIGMKRALVVSDPGIVAAGHTERGIESLKRFEIDVELFDGVAANPTTAHVEAGLHAAKRILAGRDRRPGRRQLDGLR